MPKVAKCFFASKHWIVSDLPGGPSLVPFLGRGGSTIIPISLCFIVTPHTRCRLKLLKLERIKDFLLMEEELIQNQEILKPQEQKHEVHTDIIRNAYTC